MSVQNLETASTSKSSTSESNSEQSLSIPAPALPGCSACWEKRKGRVYLCCLLTCRLVHHQIAYFILHSCEGFPRGLLCKEPYSLQVGEDQQVLRAIALKKMQFSSTEHPALFGDTEVSGVGLQSPCPEELILVCVFYQK